MQIADMVGSREEAAKVLEGKFPGLRDGFLFTWPEATGARTSRD